MADILFNCHKMTLLLGGIIIKIYKDKQYLIFDFEDGKTVKYDFATKSSIGIKGKPVTKLSTQLKGLSIKDMIECCEDKKYAKFLSFVADNNRTYGMSNVGTLLNKIPRYARYEQIFSAGLDGIINYSRFSGSINDIPKSCIKMSQMHNIKVSDAFVQCWHNNVDAYNLAYNLSYISLSDEDLNALLSSCDSHYDADAQIRYTSHIGMLIEEYGYNAKALYLYIDRLKTYEAITDMRYLLREVMDYARMMNSISPKYDKYPRHFLTTHKIATRNYNRLKQEFSEQIFQKRIKPEYEYSFGKYRFIYPRSIQEIKEEAVMQHNCVASYISKVINGDCHIMFLRYKDAPDKGLVTLEIRNNRIVQALRRFNDPLTQEDQRAVDAWNKKYAKNAA